MLHRESAMAIIHGGYTALQLGFTAYELSGWHLLTDIRPPSKSNACSVMVLARDARRPQLRSCSQVMRFNFLNERLGPA
jgi:hypothetical protein